MNKKVLVTGGLGFIGSHVVEELLQRDYSVDVVDDLSTGNEKNKIEHENVNYLIKDFTDVEILFDIKNNKYGAIFHLAAVASVPVSVLHPIKTHEENLTKTLKLIDACSKAHTIFIFSSTSAVYGKFSNPASENDVVNPMSQYAAQKAAVELYCKTYDNLYGLKYACLRYFNVYGPRQNPKGAYPNVISSWASNLSEQNTINFYGDGHQVRDYVFVKDVAKVNVDIFEYMIQQKKASLTLNVGSGESYSLNELFDMFQKYFKKIHVARLPPRPGDVQYTACSLEQLEKYISFKPKKLKIGLKETIKWYKENK